MKIFFILFFLSYSLIAEAQIEMVKWEKTEIRYAKNFDEFEQNHSSTDQNNSASVLKSLASAYWFFISDLDGNNCPFRPSCSRFFIEAVSETNLVQGTLMFADRFTRDLNIFNRLNKYPRTSSSYLYDPISLYTLDESKIRYLPPQTYIHVE